MGVGLLGGSLGLALRRHRLASHVVGLCRRESSALDAVTYGAVDSATLDPQTLGSADLIVVATPLSMFAQSFRLIAQHATQPCIVTDVGSTKVDVCRLASRLLPASARFVGSHPMAGSEKTGVEHASAELFSGAACIVCDADDENAPAAQAVSDMWTKLGMTVTRMPAATHDRLVAQISHVPHVVASLLVNLASDAALAIAGPGFRDVTRVASGDAALWVDILRANRKAVRDTLTKLASEVDRIAHVLAADDAEPLEEMLTNAKRRRDDALASRAGAGG